MSQSQVSQQNQQTQSGCGCGGNRAARPPAKLDPEVVKRVKKRQDAIYKTKSKLFI